MAIYSCNLASIGRSTQVAAGTAGAHLRYITREGAEAVVDGHAMPLDPSAAQSWMNRAEANDRKNARVADKIRIAIPRELSKEQRLQLVRDFCEDVTGGSRVPWLFAIHQEGKDAHNPHAHIVIRDRDLETGKRVLRLSDSARDRQAAGLEPSACHWIRARWEAIANRALERAGQEARIDRRTLDAQGIERDPTIHIGPRARHVDEFVQRPRSKKKTNAIGREIDYEAIDAGRTRKDRHAEIIDLNLERAARSPQFETRVWAQFERDQFRLDRKLEGELSEQTRKRTAEERALKRDYRRQFAAIRTQRKAAYQAGLAEQRVTLAPRIASLRARQRGERDALHDQQHSFWSRVFRAVDITGGTRRRHHQARRELVAAHKRERGSLARDTRKAWLALKESTTQRFAPEEQALKHQYAVGMAAMKQVHRRGEAIADARRQLREADREQQRLKVVEAIRVARTVEGGRSSENDQALDLAERPAANQGARKDQARAAFDKAKEGREADIQRLREEVRQRLKRPPDRGLQRDR